MQSKCQTLKSDSLDFTQKMTWNQHLPARYHSSERRCERNTAGQPAETSVSSRWWIVGLYLRGCLSVWYLIEFQIESEQRGLMWLWITCHTTWWMFTACLPRHSLENTLAHTIRRPPLTLEPETGRGASLKKNHMFVLAVDSHRGGKEGRPLIARVAVWFPAPTACQSALEWDGEPWSFTAHRS